MHKYTTIWPLHIIDFPVTVVIRQIKKLPQHWLKFWIPALLLKVVAAISLGLIYKYYYGVGDTFSLFDDGKLLAKLAIDQPDTYLQVLWQTVKGRRVDDLIILANANPRAVAMSVFNSVLCLLSGNNYWLSAFYAAILNFLALTTLVYTLEKIFKLSKQSLLIAFFFYPSVLLWTSGLLKENVLLACLSIVSAIILRLLYPEFFKKRIVVISLLYWLILAFSLLIIYRLKYYYLAVYLPVVIAYSVVVIFKKKQSNTVFRSQKILFIGVFLFTILLATSIHPNLNLDKVVAALVLNHDIMVEETSKPENLIQYNNLKASFSSVLKNTPKAFWEGLARPYLWEQGNWLKKISGLENLLFLLLLFGALFKWGQSGFKTKYSIEVLAVCAFSLVLLLMLALSAPNLGNLVRYKTGFIPFLILLLVSAVKRKE
ncbi:hypothetical protein [Chondrinema litorale]|uniref:hypothetical protein n=1 Tax=Chondrinema litorale TaxID=2994555 RepID=UPI0025435A79|nr:hypothetical protein [Chondrinema litorale]UZR94548.1 hypothetical protein OQ292_01775 [Chondrinema litorale]